MPPNNTSQRIVSFLSKLAHFQYNFEGNEYVAERITDGTVFLCPSNPENQENGLLEVYWQGDQKRRSMVEGTQVAEFEIITSVKHWVATGSMKDEQSEIEHLFQHFKYKTGTDLNFEKDDSFFPKSLEKLFKDLGWTAFKKIVGL